MEINWSDVFILFSVFYVPILVAYQIWVKKKKHDAIKSRGWSKNIGEQPAHF